MKLTTSKVIDKAARESFYSGAIIVLKQLTAATALCDYFANSFLDERLCSSDLSMDDRINYCEKFETSDQIHSLYTEIFREAGLVHNETHWDRLRLRVQHAGDPVDDYQDASTFGSGRFSSTLPIHRDTWGSQITQQLNWWMPLKPLREQSTLLLYPSFFNTAVPNASKSWSLKELKRARKQGKPYPQLPTMEIPTEDLTYMQEQLAQDAQPVLIETGDVLVFSGSHLHGSATGGEPGSWTRFSTEVRTVNIPDLENNIGAPNIDGPEVLTPQRKWFHPLVL